MDMHHHTMHCATRFSDLEKVAPLVPCSARAHITCGWTAHAASQEVSVVQAHCLNPPQLLEKLVSI